MLNIPNTIIQKQTQYVCCLTMQIQLKDMDTGMDMVCVEKKPWYKNYLKCNFISFF
jgi:hypothetical protein